MHGFWHDNLKTKTWLKKQSCVLWILSVSSNIWIYDSVRKITTDQWDDYTTVCLLDYNYFKNYNKMIAKDLSKQQALDTDMKAIQLIAIQLTESLE